MTSQIANGTVKDIEKNIEDYGKLVAKLSLLHPEQGTEGVLIALREAISGGNFRSARFRLDVSPQQIAHSIGKDLSQIVGNPELTRQAFEAFANQFIGDQAMNQMGNLFSVRIGKLYDAIRHGMAKIGDSGIFDAVTDKFGEMAKKLFSYFESGAFEKYAQRISNSLVRIFDNVVKAIDQFVRGVTGATDSESTVGAFVERLTKLFEILAEKSDGLPDFFKGLSTAVTSITSSIGNLIQMLSGLASMLYKIIPGSSPNSAENIKAFDSYLSDQGVNAKSRVRRMYEGGKFLEDGGSDHTDLATGNIFQRKALAVEEKFRDYGTYFDGDYSREQKQAMSAAHAKAKYVEDASGRYSVLNTIELNKILSDAGLIGGSTPQKAAASIPNSAGSPLYNILREEGINMGFSNYSSFRGAFFDDKRAQKEQNAAAFQPKAYAINPYESNFKAQTLSYIQGFGTLGDTAFDATNPLNILMNKIGPMTTQKFSPSAESGGLGGILESMSVQYKKSVNTLNQDYKKLQQLSGDLEEEGLFNWSDDVKHLMTQVSDRMKTLPKDYQDAINGVREMSIHGVQQFGQSIVEMTKDLPPQARQILIDQVIQGTTALGLAVAKGLNMPADQVRKTMGLESMPLYAQNRILADRFSAGETAFGERARYGDMAGTPAGQQIVDSITSRPSGFAQNPVGTAKDQVAYLQAELPQYVATYDDAVQKLGKANGGFQKSLAIRDLEMAKTNLAAISAKLTEMREKADLLKGAWMDFGKAVEDSMTKGLGDALYNILTKTGTIKDALIGFAQSIARAWSDMIAKIAMQKILGNDSTAAGGPGVVGLLLKALGAGGGQTSGAGAGAGAPLPEVTTPLMISQGAATGAVWHGGFTPISAFANGGIVNRPVVGIVGEGKYPGEAMVPLPDGRTIPVTMTGGGGGAPGNIYVIASMEDAVRHGFRAHKDDIVDIAVADMKKGGKLAKTLRRRNPGR